MRFDSVGVNSCPTAENKAHQPIMAAGGEPVIAPFFRTAKNIWLSISVCRHCGLVFGIQDTILNDSEEADEVDRQLSEIDREMKHQRPKPFIDEPEP